jgi:hypothetical protein
MLKDLKGRICLVTDLRSSVIEIIFHTPMPPQPCQVTHDLSQQVS